MLGPSLFALLVFLQLFRRLLLFDFESFKERSKATCAVYAMGLKGFRDIFGKMVRSSITVVDRIGVNTTVPPPAKAFGKTLSALTSLIFNNLSGFHQCPLVNDRHDWDRRCDRIRKWVHFCR
jgi:hypothetical protein